MDEIEYDATLEALVPSHYYLHRAVEALVRLDPGEHLAFMLSLDQQRALLREGTSRATEAIAARNGWLTEQ